MNTKQTVEAIANEIGYDKDSETYYTTMGELNTWVLRSERENKGKTIEQMAEAFCLERQLEVTARNTC